MAANNNHPIIHAEVYGDPGTLKSTFAATFPTPILVFFWEPMGGQEFPYFRRGNVSDLLVNEAYDIYYRDVTHRKTDDLLVRIEYFRSVDLKQPTAYRAFLSRLQAFHSENDQWGTVVIDSATFLELEVRKNEQYHLNPAPREVLSSIGTKKGTSFDPRQWWSGATNELEEILSGTFGSFALNNVVVLCHIDEDKDEVNGTILRKPKLPGRLGKGTAAGFSEVYHSYIDRDSGEALLQTRADHIFLAKSQINAPNPAIPHYAALWEGWDAQ